MKVGGEERLVPDLDPYLVPLSVKGWHDRIGFIVDPLFDSAVAAGATFLDPTESLCLDGECPLVDPAGWPTYVNSDHLSLPFVEVYASFIDVTVGLSGVAREPREYCV